MNGPFASAQGARQHYESLLRVTHSLNSSVLLGVSAVPVEVQARAVSVLPKKPKQWGSAASVSGVPPGVARQMLTRLSAAFVELGWADSQVEIVANVHGLSDADARAAAWRSIELPLAIVLLQAAGKLPPLVDPGKLLVLGALDASGACRHCPGVVSLASVARAGQGVIAPVACEAELGVLAAVQSGFSASLVYGLQHAIDVIFRGAAGELVRYAKSDASAGKTVDLAEVVGQERAKRAVEIAAAGMHSLLLVGGPGTGKTMLARALQGVMPEMDEQEQLEVLRAYSAAGLTIPLGVRPFRTVHHSASRQAVVGGGGRGGIEVGEVTLAHGGVLFLDELPEFSRDTLEALRQPLEDREVTISRVSRKVKAPCVFLLVAAANPCPCGWFGVGDSSRCRCAADEVERYQKRVSGPLLDRFDLIAYTEAVAASAILGDSRGREGSDAVKQRVQAARDRQVYRFATLSGVRANGAVDASSTLGLMRLTGGAKEVIEEIADERGWSGRKVTKAVRVARTIADLAGSEEVKSEHVLGAAEFVN